MDNMSQFSVRLGSRFVGKSSSGEHAAVAGPSDGAAVTK
jgi:hypothetical protein